MHWVPHVTACMQGPYVICSSKGIQWCWGMYLLRGEIKQLVVEWTGGLVGYHHSYNDFDYWNRYGGRLELRFSIYLAFQTRHMLHTIRARRRIGQYISVSETLTWQLDQSLQIIQASLLLLFPLVRNMTLKDMENHCCEGTTNPQSEVLR